MKKIKKAFKIIAITLVIATFVVIACLSPIAKYLIEKYDKELTGREIKMAWMYVNPFTGYIFINHLNIYEVSSDSVFFSAKGLSVNIAMLKLFIKKYEFTEVILDEPKGIIKQNYKTFNFSDLIERFSSKNKIKKNKKSVEFKISNIKINDGLFYYEELITPIKYFIKKVNITCDVISSDVDTIPIQFSFLSGIGKGALNGQFNINSKNNDYRLKILIKQLDLNFIGQYIKDLSNYGNFKAYLDADFSSNGNLLDKTAVSNKGFIKISDFHFGKTTAEDFASFEKLEIAIHELSPKRLIYYYDSIELHKPYFKFEKYDYLDNVQTVFGKAGSKVKEATTADAKYNLVIEIARYIKVLSKNFLRSNYRVDRFGIYDGNIKFNDYTLSEKFSIGLSAFNFTADSIDKRNKRVDFNLSSAIKPYGNIKMGISINPKDSSDFDLNFNFQKLSAAMFNPYLIKYTSFPLDRGTIEINGQWNVRNGLIKSKNHLVVIDPRVGNKLKNNNSSWLPMRLIMFVVRERGNVIDYEIPIIGDLKNPKFVLKDAIFDALGNVFIKPPTTPYRMEVRNIETAIEKSLTLTWQMRNSKISKSQIDFLERMADFIAANPLARISVTPYNFESKEKEGILLYEIKKKYYLKLYKKSANQYDESDSITVEKMSIKDSLFLKYINEQVKDVLVFTTQEKAQRIIDTHSVNLKYAKLNEERLALFLNYFKVNDHQSRVKIMKSIKTVPYNGYSYLKINYEGEFPEKLLKAYSKISSLNNESPRDKYKRWRNKK